VRKIFIIAEAGINHNGDLGRALEMVDAAARSGADAVKFQTFKAEKVISRFAPKAEYQLKTTDARESQLEMARKLELDFAAFTQLHHRCRERRIQFLSTAFDSESIDFLAGLGLKTMKIPSGEITHLPYLRKMGGLGGKLIVSTGMADLREVEAALDVLLGAGMRKADITLLHCNTEYPTQMEDVNLRAMLTLQKAFGVDVGYSDHTPGIEVAVAAAALGAVVLEKHFTLDKALEGPDHRASLAPSELDALVKAVRNIEKALGDGVKKASPSESRNKPIARRSIVAARAIRRGEALTEENLAAKRPGTGVSPMEWDRALGSLAVRDFAADELIEL